MPTVTFGRLTCAIAMLLCCGISQMTMAQPIPLGQGVQTNVAPAVVPLDSVVTEPPVAVRSPKMTKDPVVAILYSVMMPGLGQVYTEEYWKIPLFTGVAATSAYLFFDNHGKYRDADRAYLAAIDTNATASTIDLLLRQREVYRDNRDVSAAVLLTTYLIAAVDAFVGAHLFDFDVSDDVSMHVGPLPATPLACTLIARF